MQTEYRIPTIRASALVTKAYECILQFTDHVDNMRSGVDRIELLCEECQHIPNPWRWYAPWRKNLKQGKKAAKEFADECVAPFKELMHQSRLTSAKRLHHIDVLSELVNDAVKKELEFATFKVSDFFGLECWVKQGPFIVKVLGDERRKVDNAVLNMEKIKNTLEAV